jgi:hypothetical protein
VTRVAGLSAGRDTIVQVKRALAWFAGLVGIAALGRFLAGRSKAKPVTATPHPKPATDGVDAIAGPEGDPAEELRRTLAATRATAGPTEEESVDERRARVHAEARETIEAMADDGGGT